MTPFATDPTLTALPVVDLLSGLLPLAQAAGVEPAEVEYGPFTAWWKLLLLLVMIVAFLRALQWVDKDATPARLPREAINCGLWALLALALVLIVVLPAFVMVLGSTLLLLAGGIGGYLAWRNTTVGLKDIPDQLSAYFKALVTPKRKGDRVKEKEKEESVAAGNVTLLDKGGNKPARPDDDDATGRLGYETAHAMLADPLNKKAERIGILQIAPRPATAEAPAQARYGTKMTVDGVDHAGVAYDAGGAVAALAWLKGLAGLEVEEQRKVQSGPFKARTPDGVRDLLLTTRGTRNGETALIEVDPKTRYKLHASQLGFSQPQKEQLELFREGRSGVCLVAAPEGGGLDALEYGLLLEHDAFTQHILTAERSIRRELEGIAQNAVGDDPKVHAKQYSWIGDQQPDVLLADQPAGADAAQSILRLVAETDDGQGRIAYVGLRADDVAAAIASWIRRVGDAKTALRPLKLVIAGRIVRTLCEACKVPYEPGDKVLAKLGVPKGKVDHLFRARTEPMVDQKGNAVVCSFCGGLGYTGRTGVFEVLAVDGEARKQLMKDPSPSVVRNLLKANKLRTLNESAIRHVVGGRTDLAEVQRVFDAGSASSSSAAKTRRTRGRSSGEVSRDDAARSAAS